MRINESVGLLFRAARRDRVRRKDEHGGGAAVVRINSVYRETVTRTSDTGLGKNDSVTTTWK